MSEKIKRFYKGCRAPSKVILMGIIHSHIFFLGAHAKVSHQVWISSQTPNGPNIFYDNYYSRDVIYLCFSFGYANLVLALVTYY